MMFSNRPLSRRLAAVAALGAVTFFLAADARALEIPFVDLPNPYEPSGPFVSVPAAVVGGAIGLAAGVLFIPPMLIVAILPGIGLLDALLGPPQVGWQIGKHTIGRVVGLPFLLIKGLFWDLPRAVIGV